MKKMMRIKIISMFACLFFLCSFFSIETSEQQVFHTLSKDNSISYVVPRGVYMEMQTEEVPAGETVIAKQNASRTISLFRYLLLWGWIAAIVSGYAGTRQFLCENPCIDFLYSTIRYIHDTDGRKRQ